MPTDDERALFMISVAAELAGVHPQTLRMYERRGLLRPQRTAKNTRRYSPRDVERLQRIQQLTELGLNLAGVERVLAMELIRASMASTRSTPAGWRPSSVGCWMRCKRSSSSPNSASTWPAWSGCWPWRRG